MVGLVLFHILMPNNCIYLRLSRENILCLGDTTHNKHNEAVKPMS